METKQRHWALTFYLVFCMASLLVSTLSVIFAKQAILNLMPATPDWYFIVNPIVSAVSLAGLIALFRFHKWGFWIQIPIALTFYIVNVKVGQTNLNEHPIGALYGLMGPLILFGFLKIGGPKQGWKQLT